METKGGNKELNADTRKKSSYSSETYPVETVDNALKNAIRLALQYGTAKVMSKEEISEALKRKLSTLTLYLSTYIQYGIMKNVRGRGYMLTELFKSYYDRLNRRQRSSEEMCYMFYQAPLYRKLIDIYNGEVLPAPDVLPNILRNDPFNVHKNSCARASKVFFDNIEYLGFLERSSYKLRFALQEQASSTPPPSYEPKSSGVHTESEGYSTFVVVLSDDRKATIKLPPNVSYEDKKRISSAILGA